MEDPLQGKSSHKHQAVGCSKPYRSTFWYHVLLNMFHLFRRQSPCFNLHNVATSLFLLDTVDTLRIQSGLKIPISFSHSPSYLHWQGTAGSSARGAAGVFPGALTGVGDGGQRGFQAAGASSCDFRKGDRLAEKWRSEERKTRSLVISVRFFCIFWSPWPFGKWWSTVLERRVYLDDNVKSPRRLSGKTYLQHDLARILDFCGI